MFKKSLDNVTVVIIGFKNFKKNLKHFNKSSWLILLILRIEPFFYSLYYIFKMLVDYGDSD